MKDWILRVNGHVRDHMILVEIFSKVYVIDFS